MKLSVNALPLLATQQLLLLREAIYCCFFYVSVARIIFDRTHLLLTLHALWC
jgi:hypothetical protein